MKDILTNWFQANFLLLDLPFIYIFQGYEGSAWGKIKTLQYIKAAHSLYTQIIKRPVKFPETSTLPMTSADIFWVFSRVKTSISNTQSLSSKALYWLLVQSAKKNNWRSSFWWRSRVTTYGFGYESVTMRHPSPD